MFNLDNWREIFETLHKNKLRTFLTSLSVASGIFILVILLGFSQGMQNGIRKEFQADATNVVWVWSEVTTKEYKGLNPGRRIEVRNENFDYANKVFQEDIEYKSANMWRGGLSATYKSESGSYGVVGVHPNMQQIENSQMVSGRFINEDDIDKKLKVIVISQKIRNELMKDVEKPVNEYLQIGGINFQVIGVYSDFGGEREENRIFVPISTLQTTFNGADKVGSMSFTIAPRGSYDETVEASNQFVSDLKTYLKEAHTIAPDDDRAIGVNNALDEAKRFYTLTDNMALFFWFVGICTIIAGVAGVSNIMLIVVKERTKEIGIRKAIGAKPWSIINMILHESIFVTALAGFAGLILGMALLEIVGPNIEVDYVSNPSVDFSMAMTMVFVLVIAGTLAGFIPAYKAAHIKPIEALKHE